jgi:hypothetical protein
MLQEALELAGSCEVGDALLGSLNGGEYPDSLSDYQLAKDLLHRVS